MAIQESHLLDQLLIVFIEKGYASTSTRELADRCGIAEITLFRKYGTKKELFSKAVMHYLETHSFSDFTWDEHDTLEDMLIKLLERRYQFVATHHAVLRMLIAETLYRKWPDEFNVIQRMQQRNVAYIEHYAKDHDLTLDVTSLATMMLGFIMSEIIRSQHDQFVWSSDDAMHQRIESYVRQMLS